jgi:hypothetical protein
MPRKYEDLAHLSVEEYRIEAEKRREKERTEYRHQYYLNKKKPERKMVSQKTKINKIENKIAKLMAQKESLAAGVNICE